MIAEAVVFDGFVGRDEELAYLVNLRARSAREARGTMVAIVGEAGIGKTRLLSEFERAARRDRGAFVRVRCEQPPEPYAPLVRALAILREYRELRSSLKLRAAFEAMTVTDEPDHGDAVDRKGALHDALVAAFAEASKRLTHLTLIVDDAHWIDLSSLEALRAVATGLAECAATTIVTYRPEELESDHKRALAIAAFERDGADRIKLGPLSFGEMLPLWNARIPNADRALLRRIYDLAEGKPYAAEELTRSALEAAAEPNPAAVTSLQFAILERAARLDARDRAVIDVCAVLGRHFAGADLEAFGASAAELVSALRAALGLQLLEEFETGGEPWYRFRHALTREILYENIAPETRERLHRSIADQLEATGRVAEFAYHAFAAGDRARALGASERAGDVAIGLAAYADAVPLFDRVVNLATDPETFSRAAVKLARCLERDGDTDALLATSRSLAERLRENGRVDEAIEVTTIAYHAVQMTRFADVLELFRRANDLLPYATTTNARFEVELMNAWVASCRSTLDEALAACARGEAALEHPTTAQRNRIAITRAVAYLRVSRLADAERALGERVHEPNPEGERALATTKATLAILDYARGRTRSAFESCLSAAERYRGLHHERLAFIQECNAAFYAAEIGDFAYVASILERARAKGDLQNDILEAAHVRMVRAVGGDPEELLNLFERALESRMQFLVAALARDLAFIVEGDRARARAIALRAIDCMPPGQLDENLLRAVIEFGEAKDLERVEPLLAASFTEDEVLLRANDALVRARVAAREHRSIEAAALARLALEIGAGTERWMHFASAYELAGDFAAARSTLERVGAVEELRRLEHRTRARAPAPAPDVPKLTLREQQIAQLLASGLTSREVGDRLDIGKRTVEAHLAKMYAKLGINSRAELIETYQKMQGASSQGRARERDSAYLTEEDERGRHVRREYRSGE